MLTFIIDALVTVVGVTTPILLAATGELVVEKSGVLNLGVEGMMLIGAVTGFAIALTFGDGAGALAPWLGVVCAALAGAASSMLFAVLVLTLGSNQVATGLALTIFGIGLSSLIGAGFVGATTAIRSSTSLTSSQIVAPATPRPLPRQALAHCDPTRNLALYGLDDDRANLKEISKPATRSSANRNSRRRAWLREAERIRRRAAARRARSQGERDLRRRRSRRQRAERALERDQRRDARPDVRGDHACRP